MSEPQLQRHLFTVACFVLGCLLGAAVGSFESDSKPPSQDSRKERVSDSPESAPRRGSSAPQRSASGVDATPLRRPSTPSLHEIFQAASRVSALRSALTELAPRTSLWPDEVPESMRPEVFEEHLDVALELVGAGEVEAINCDEYPCVATLILPADDGEIDPGEGLGILMNVRKELSVLLGMAVDAHMDTHPSGIRLTLSAHPDTVEGVRLRQRLEEAWLLASQ